MYSFSIFCLFKVGRMQNLSTDLEKQETLLTKHCTWEVESCNYTHNPKRIPYLSNYITYGKVITEAS